MEPQDNLIAGLAKIGLVLKQQAWQADRPGGLSPLQAQVLTVLAARPAGTVSVKAVAAEVGVNMPTTSEAVTTLAGKGLIRKARGESDRRVVVLTLTKAGRAAASAASGWPDALRMAVDALDGSERAAFGVALTKMIRNLQLQGVIPVQRMCVSCVHFRPHAYHDQAAPHHCAFVDAPFGGGQLQFDCPDHRPLAATAAASGAIWQTFIDPTGKETRTP